MEESFPQGIAPDIEALKYSGGKWQKQSLSVPQEFPFTIYLNGLELVTIMCSPIKLNCLVLGYLFSEGFIKDVKEVVSMRVCEDDAMADVQLKQTDIKMPTRKVLTSGCGGGISFNVDAPVNTAENIITPEQALSLMRQLMENASAYNRSGGIHTSAICDNSSILAVAEDIGRHNTLDKLIGECLLRKISTSGKILLASGRVSSEMMRKAAIMQAPIVISLTSPTERAVLLARDKGITTIGYARGNHLTVYSHPQRLSAAVS
jgi:FdhD protein